jgi:hypothetical protein
MRGSTFAFTVFLIILALAATLLIAGLRSAAELTANWAYYTLLAVIVLILVEVRLPWLEGRVFSWVRRTWESFFAIWIAGQRKFHVGLPNGFWAILTTCVVGPLSVALLLVWFVALSLHLPSLAQNMAMAFYAAIIVLVVTKLVELRRE